MSERLYPICLGSACETKTGWCGERQVLLWYTFLGNCFVIHWFTASGQFLQLERIPLSVAAPTHPGSGRYRHDPAFERYRDEQLSALEDRLGYRPGGIRVQRFESDEASIADLPSEYMEFLEAPDTHSEEERNDFEEWMDEWQRKGWFVLCLNEEYWFSAEGELMAG